MTIVGKTTDGKYTISGIFKMFDTLGLPLDVIFQICVEKNMMPSWIHFYNEARAAGWKHKTIISRLSDSINDVYGKEFSDVVITRLHEVGRLMDTQTVRAGKCSEKQV